MGMGNGFDYGNTGAPGGGGYAGGYAGGFGPAPQGPPGYGPPSGYGGYVGPGGYGDRYADDYDDGYDDEYDDEYAEGSHPAVKWGLIFGIVMSASILAPILVLIALYPIAASNPLFALVSVLQQHPDATVGWLVAILGASGMTNLIALFLAGFLTTRETGTIPSGMVAGVLADVSSTGVLILIVLILVMLEGPHRTGSMSVGGAVVAGIGDLLQQFCCLVSVVVPSAIIAMLGAGLARLIWGPA